MAFFKKYVLHKGGGISTGLGIFPKNTNIFSASLKLNWKYKHF